MCRSRKLWNKEHQFDSIWLSAIQSSDAWNFIITDLEWEGSVHVWVEEGTAWREVGKETVKFLCVP